MKYPRQRLLTGQALQQLQMHAINVSSDCMHCQGCMAAAGFALFVCPTHSCVSGCQPVYNVTGAEVSVSPVMGKGFRMERAPASDHPTCLLFATGSGISPIKALIESEELQVYS
jgi:hypothetical protein